MNLNKNLKLFSNCRWKNSSNILSNPHFFSTTLNKSVAINGFRQDNKNQDLTIPQYLTDTYWWAYIHPRAVKFWERQILVDTILWGNFSKLRDEALIELEHMLNLYKRPKSYEAKKVLQIACVYGNFTNSLARLLSRPCNSKHDNHSLYVIDIADIQLENTRKKLENFSSNNKENANVVDIKLCKQNSNCLQFENEFMDYTILFFLLHEMPENYRQETINEAIRVTKPGGKIVIIDYHKPSKFNPLKYIMKPIFIYLEPFALDLWKTPLTNYIHSKYLTNITWKYQTFFGGLYQKIVIRKRNLDCQDDFDDDEQFFNQRPKQTSEVHARGLY